MTIKIGAGGIAVLVLAASAGADTIGLPVMVGNAMERAALESTLLSLGHTVVPINPGEWDIVDVVMSHPGAADATFGPSVDEIAAGVAYVQISDWGSDWTLNSWMAIDQDAPVDIAIDADHPITDGVDPAWTTFGFWHYGFSSDYYGWSTDVGLTSLASTTNYAQSHLLVAQEIGEGRAVYIGWNVYGDAATENDVDILSNAIDWAVGAQACIADCDGNGELNILDFVCYQGLFQAGDPGADCNGDGELNILDFVCFQGAFLAGCP